MSDSRFLPVVLFSLLALSGCALQSAKNRKALEALEQMKAYGPLQRRENCELPAVVRLAWFPAGRCSQTREDMPCYRYLKVLSNPEVCYVADLREDGWSDIANEGSGQK